MNTTVCPFINLFGISFFIYVIIVLYFILVKVYDFRDGIFINRSLVCQNLRSYKNKKNNNTTFNTDQ